MSILGDARKVVRLFSGALSSRAAIAEAERLDRQRGPLPPRHFQVAVYFADGPVNLYQMRQWYAPLVKLAETRPVVVIARAASGAAALLKESPLPVVYARTIDDVESLLASQQIRVVLYVNQNTRNFQMFRYGHRWHVFISHGESDKVYMRSNQIGAYDYAFVAGDAAIARLRGALWDYDIDRRALPIGRPQADYFGARPAPYPADGRVTVFYAPTWEGDRASMSYGSIVTHGEALAAAVLADPTLRLVFRPHPRSGVSDREYGVALRRIVAAIGAANAADPTAHHVFDESPDLDWQLLAPDIAVMDVSAMVYDRLATGKALFVTRPVDPAAVIDDEGYLSECEWLDARDAADVGALVTRAQQPDVTARLAQWSQHYFGDTTPGAATARFEDAIGRLVAEWEVWHARAGAQGIDDEEVQSFVDADSEEDDPED